MRTPHPNCCHSHKDENYFSFTHCIKDIEALVKIMQVAISASSLASRPDAGAYCSSNAKETENQLVRK